MNSSRQRAVNGARALATTLGLAIGLGANAGELRVTIPDVWGAAEVEAGRIDKRISRIEHQPTAGQPRQKGARLVALCAAYILKGDLDSAGRHCEAAVKQPYLRPLAYNNRGVLRALQGDFYNARRDFRTAQSGSPYESYQESPMKKAARQILKQNTEYSEQLWANSIKNPESRVADAR